MKLTKQQAMCMSEGDRQAMIRDAAEIVKKMILNEFGVVPIEYSSITPMTIYALSEDICFAVIRAALEQDDETE